MKVKEKIIFIAPSRSSFIVNDIKILSEKYEVIENIYNWKNKPMTPLLMIQQLFFLLRYGFSVDTIMISFGGYWAYFPSMFGAIFQKKVLIIVHGTDCAAFEEIQYGVLRKPILKKIISASFKMADMLLPVSESLVNTENTYFKDEPIKLGYNHHLKNIQTPHTVIPNGISISQWNINLDGAREKNSFITVLSPGQLRTKGINLILDIADKFPQATFYFAGIDNPFNYEVPSNTCFLGRLSQKKLENLYNQTEYYLQLSNFEGFGIALCEAMLCGCIPIGSNVNKIPEIIGDTGFILEKRDPELLITLLGEAMSEKYKREKGEKARKRIMDNFSLESRKQKIFDTIDKLSSK
jgi:glycosyltransferase involved in cell wall biosynthesis